MKRAAIEEMRKLQEAQVELAELKAGVIVTPAVFKSLIEKADTLAAVAAGLFGEDSVGVWAEDPEKIISKMKELAELKERRCGNCRFPSYWGDKGFGTCNYAYKKVCGEDWPGCVRWEPAEVAVRNPQDLPGEQEA